MFAYCCNNPVVFQDESGHNSALVDGIRGALWTLPLVDGPSVVGDIVCIIGLVALYLYDQAQTEEKTATVTSKSIDWNGGDKNHILKGTGKSHINGWKRFGIDPNKNGSWELLLPILMEVVDDADRVDPKQLPDGSMIILYFKTYAEQGVEVMVKIWVDITGYIQQISDAIPYIID